MFAFQGLITHANGAASSHTTRIFSHATIASLTKVASCCVRKTGVSTDRNTDRTLDTMCVAFTRTKVRSVSQLFWRRFETISGVASLDAMCVAFTRTKIQSVCRLSWQRFETTPSFAFYYSVEITKLHQLHLVLYEHSPLLVLYLEDGRARMLGIIQSCPLTPLRTLQSS